MLGSAPVVDTILCASELPSEQSDGVPPQPDELKSLEDAVVLMFATLLVELRAEGALSAAAQSRMFERI